MLLPVKSDRATYSSQDASSSSSVCIFAFDTFAGCFSLTNKPNHFTCRATKKNYKKNPHCVFRVNRAAKLLLSATALTANTSCFDVRLRYQAFTCCRKFRNCKFISNEITRHLTLHLLHCAPNIIKLHYEIRWSSYSVCFTVAFSSFFWCHIHFYFQMASMLISR